MAQEYLRFFFHAVCRLHTEWYTLEQLFITKHDDSLYSGRTGLFFSHLHFYLHEAVYLNIAKLFDNDKRVASLPIALSNLGLSPNDPRRLELESDYKVLRQACAPIIEQRNVLLAHNNREIVFNRKAAPAPPVEDVRQVLAGIRKLVNKMSGYLGEREVLFDTLNNSTGVVPLLEVLEAGNAALDAVKSPTKP